MISVRNIENVVYHAGSMILQTGIGYFSGHFINAVALWLNPGKVVLGRSANLAIQPWDACAAVAIFTVVDLIAKAVLEQLPFKESLQKPLYQLIRIAVSVTVSSLIASAILGITINMAAVAIVSSIIASTILMGLAKLYSGFTDVFMLQGTPATDRN